MSTEKRPRRGTSAAMTDDSIFEEIRQCIEMIADAERQCDKRNEPDVCLTRDGAHKIVATLAEAAETIERGND
jgi:acetylornithine deacetylase/succinyl-diaminopimelate desuccinylase-like protein